MPHKAGIFVALTPEQESIHRARRAAMGRRVTWGAYLEKLAELADAKVLEDAGER